MRYFIFLLVAFVAPCLSSPQAPTKELPPSNEAAAAPAEQESVEEELEPAALQLDVTGASPLIQALYAATRETKERLILDHLAEAKRLIADADIRSVDKEGRTALHWAVFGSSYTTKPRVLVAYEEIASDLVDRGIDINREDSFNDTALDYLLYSPNFEMQTLLIEHGATSGFLAANFPLFQESSNGRPNLSASGSKIIQADLAPGATIDVRLNGPVYSDRSRTGDPVSATVTYPLCKNGEYIACNPGELVLAPGTEVNGTVLFSQKAPDKYSRPRLVLDFSNIVHTDGRKSALYARVLSVNNARETVRNNEILGIIQPHASTKTSLAMTVIGASNPVAGYAIKGLQAVYGLSIRREIAFPAGTDLQVQVVRPSMLKEKVAWPGWPTIPVDAKLRALIGEMPARTQTGSKTPSDLTNLVFLGSRQQLISAFDEAGWFQADNLSIASAAKTVGATVRQSSYASAPVSGLRIDGQMPDLVFQKSLNTFAMRHHLRIWKQPGAFDNREVWLGAATHDIAISRARAGTKWSHRIDPHVNRERDWVETDLLFIGTAAAYADVDRPSVPKKTWNATGDQILTDGKITVVQLRGSANH